MPTRPTTVPPTAPTCVAVESSRGLRGVGRLLEPAGPPPVADRADVVVAVVLPASGGSLGSGLGAVVRVRAAGLCACLLQAPLTRQQERTTSNTTNTSDTTPIGTTAPRAPGTRHPALA